MPVDRARAEGLQLTGEGGLLQQLTKRVIESVLGGEMTDRLGYEKHDAAGRDGGNSRNGRRSKTVTTDVGPVGMSVPPDTDGTFEPQIVRKRQRRLSGVDEMSCRCRPRAWPTARSPPIWPRSTARACRSGPHRQGTSSLDDPLESPLERLRDRLRRTPHGNPPLKPTQPQINRLLDTPLAG
jgi:hypothetical protein